MTQSKKEEGIYDAVEIKRREYKTTVRMRGDGDVRNRRRCEKKKAMHRDSGAKWSGDTSEVVPLAFVVSGGKVRNGEENAWVNSLLCVSAMMLP